MSCGRARRLLWPDAGLRSVSPDVEAAERHVAGCEACRAFVDEMRYTTGVVRDLAPRPEAPAAVRNRLFQAVARARTGSPRPRHPAARWAGLAAAVALVAGIAVVWGSRRADSPDPIAGLAEDHMRATRGEGIVSSDSAVVADWLAARLPFAMDVPSLPSLELRGARLCLMDGRRGGVVEYSAEGRLVSYFVVPNSIAERPPARQGDVRVASRQGFHVAAWQEPGLLHALVGDLPESTLAELARLCLAKMMAVLGWGAGRPLTIALR